MTPEMPPHWMLWVKFSLEQHSDLVLAVGSRIWVALCLLAKTLLGLWAFTLASRECRLWMLAIRRGRQ